MANILRNKLIASIHILKKQVGMDDDLYRLFLENHTSKTSSKDMTINELNTCINALNNNSNTARNNDSNYVDTTCSRLRKILKLWYELSKLKVLNDPTNNGLNKFLINRFNTNIDKLNNNFYFNNSLKDKIVESLKSWISRAKAQKKD